MTPTVLARPVPDRRGGPRGVRLAMFGAILLFLLAGPAIAQEALKGVALVIGQADYGQLTKLANPGNDASEVERLLDRLGFSADKVDDRTAKRLRRDLDDFAEDAAGADVAVIYYSGHGIEAGGENYLVPVDAAVADGAIAADSLVAVTPILDALRERVKVVIILLDACRTNPFPPGTVLRTGNATPVAIAAGGLGVKGGTSADADSAETLAEIVGFAAAPGQVALDGEPGTNSPYAAAIVKHLAAQGLDFGQVMTLVSEEVYLRTQGRQQPWVNASLRRLLYFGGTGEEKDTDEALIRGERRELLLTIAATPLDLRRTVERIAGNGQVPLDGLYAMLGSLGIEARQDPEQLGKQLKEGAEKLKTFLAERAALESTDTEITRLSGLADRAVGEGAINAAISFHDKAKARVAALEASVGAAEADLKARRLEFAEVYAKSAKTNELAFAYLEAAEDWQRAYEQAARWDEARAFEYRRSQALALQTHGDWKGDSEVLTRSINLYQTILATVPRNSRRDDWARIQNNLGNALSTLGQRESGTARLEDAVAAFRAALEERTRDRTPLPWAATQNNLGNVLQMLGARDRGTTRFEEAVAAYRAALEERTRERVPLEWARTQNNLGTALWTLGERGGAAENFENAVAALRSALQVWTRDRSPLDWAAAQNNLGNVLRSIGERNYDAARLEEAVGAFRAALEEYSRDRIPLYWAETQNNLGIALRALGEMDGGTERLDEAVLAFNAALEELTPDQAPLDWAATQSNLAITLSILGERDGNTSRFEEAVVAYRAALEGTSREHAPRDWAGIHASLGNLLQTIGKRESGTARLEEAVTAYRAALMERTRARMPLDWARTQYNLGLALQTLGARETGASRLEEAVAAYRAALEEYTRARAPLDWAETQNNLALTMRILGERVKDRAILNEGRSYLQAARDGYKSAGYDYDAYFSEEIAKFEAAIAALE